MAWLKGIFLSSPPGGVVQVPHSVPNRGRGSAD